MSALIDPGLDYGQLPLGEFSAAERHGWLVETRSQAVEPAIFGPSWNYSGPTRAAAKGVFESAQVEPGTLHRRAVTAQTVLLEYRLDVLRE
jgi:hypothetical protein